MAQPKIGHYYRLDIKNNMRDSSIAWVNNSSKKLYSKWREIEGEILKIRSKSATTTTYIATLLKHPKDTFYVPAAVLMELTRRLQIPCMCTLQQLVAIGCQCGAFRKEQDKKKEHGGVPYFDRSFHSDKPVAT